MKWAFAATVSLLGLITSVLGLTDLELTLLVRVVANIAKGPERFGALVVGTYPYGCQDPRSLLKTMKAFGLPNVSTQCSASKPLAANTTTKELFLVTSQQPALCSLSMNFTTKYQTLMVLTESFDELKDCPLQINTNLLTFRFEKHDIFVYEVYKVHQGSPLTTKLYASYSLINSPYVVQTPWWQRRGNLEGVIFKTGVVNYAPYSISGVGGKRPTGAINDLITILGSKMNFTAEFTELGFGQFNQLVNMTGRGELHIGSGGLTMTYSRSKIADMSIPLIKSSLEFIYKTQSHDVSWLTYFRSFRRELWMAIVGYNLILTLTLFLVEMVSSNSSWSDSMGHFRSTVSFVFITALGRRFPTEPSQNLKRIAFFLVSVTGFIIISLYRAMLGASLAIMIYRKPFDSYRQIADSDYSILTIPDSILTSAFVDSPEGTVLYEIGQNNLQPLTEDPEIALEKLANGTYSKTMVLESILAMERLPQWPCEISTLDVALMQDWTILTFPKNWPYTELFNRHLLVLIESGVVDQLIKYYFKTGQSKRCPTREVAPASTGDTAAVLMLLAIGFFASTLIFFTELLSFNRRKNIIK